MPQKTALLRQPALVLSIERQLYSYRGHTVMLDADLALWYGVPTKRLNEQVKRNASRFPNDFMFRLTPQETKTLMSLRSQSATLKRGQHPKYSSLVFTEQGVAMLSSVLTSQRAIAVNIAIMRAFVKIREVSAAQKDLARTIKGMQNKYNARFRKVFETIHRWMEPAPEPEPVEPRPRIGFLADNKKHVKQQEPIL